MDGGNDRIPENRRSRLSVADSRRLNVPGIKGMAWRNTVHGTAFRTDRFEGEHIKRTAAIPAVQRQGIGRG